MVCIDTSAYFVVV